MTAVRRWLGDALTDRDRPSPIRTRILKEERRRHWARAEFRAAADHWLAKREYAN